MKKSVFKFLFAAVFTMTAGHIVYSSQQDTGISDLALANIEALANNEGGDGSCKESLTNYRIESYGDGSCRVVGEYSCGNGLGSCLRGNTYIYYGISGNIIGTDDQRYSVTCI